MKNIYILVIIFSIFYIYEIESISYYEILRRVKLD